MKINKKKIAVFLLMTLFVSIFTIGTTSAIKIDINNSFNQLSNGYEKHASIYIRNDDDFTFENGIINPDAKGTIYDPYIIGGWELNEIEIRNTQAYFIIQNCLVNGTSTAMRFENASNGHVRNCIIDNECISYYASTGIWFVYGCNNFLIEHCLIFSHHNSICIDDSYGIINNNIIVRDCVLQPKVGIWPIAIHGYHKNVLFYNNDVISKDDTWNGAVFYYPDSNPDPNNHRFDSRGAGNYWSTYEYKNPDATNNGYIWDNPYYICHPVYDNYPLVSPRFAPQKPTITGSLNGKINEEMIFNIATNSPQNVDVYLQVNWGDGNSSWIGPVNSGDEVEATHIYTEKKEYQMKVRAKDINGIVGPYSKQTIAIGKSRTISFENYLLTQLLEMYPLLTRILRLFIHV